VIVAMADAAAATAHLFLSSCPRDNKDEKMIVGTDFDMVSRSGSTPSAATGGCCR